jgi:Fe-S-cluster-containing hydrogenase component 2
MCVSACPFGAINVGPDETILVCDLCNGDPMCVKFCKPRPENTCTYLSNPKASALEYLEITALPVTTRRTQLNIAAHLQDRED